jgi:voltage-gated potassium channel Kch
VALSWVLRRRTLVPPDLVNLVSLAAVWGVFAAAEWVQSEAGISAAVAMGLAVQRRAVPEERRLRQFKEQLTVLGISILFVLLAADLPLHIVRAEGWRGVRTVAALMLVVRPLHGLASLRGSAMPWRERLFVMWIAPRGIGAASVASLFAVVLEEAGISEGSRILAITFLTIALTVTVQGITAGLVARLLGLRNPSHGGAIVIGGGPLARGVAEMLRGAGRPVTLVDRNTALVADARAAGLDAREGNALDEDVLAEAGAEEATTVVAVTPNSEVNALATHLAHDACGVEHAYPVLAHASLGAGPELLHRVGGRIAFGRAVDVRAWDVSLDEGTARFVRHTVPADGGTTRPTDLPSEVVAVGRVRGGVAEVVTADATWRGGDELVQLSRLPESATARVMELAGARLQRPTPAEPAAPVR